MITMSSMFLKLNEGLVEMTHRTLEPDRERVKSRNASIDGLPLRENLIAGWSPD